MLSVLLLAGGCAQKAEITSLPQLADKSFAVPTGTAADTLVLSKFPQAKFQYFNTVLDAARRPAQARPTRWRTMSRS